MESKKIYLIRHGQTDYNKQGIVQGSSVDTSLNETGIKQAALFYSFYKHISFDKIYTSALRRTHQSVHSFIESGIPWEQYSGLNEISWGMYDGKKATEEDRLYCNSIMAQWGLGHTNLAIGGGESPEQVLQRQLPVLQTIFSRDKEKTVLICSHGRAMKILLCHLLGLELKSMDTFYHDNLCLYELEYNNFAISMLRANNVEHLKDLSNIANY